MTPLLSKTQAVEAAKNPAKSPYPRPASQTDIYRVRVGFPIYDLGGNVSEWVQSAAGSSVRFGLIGRNFHTMDDNNVLRKPNAWIPASKNAVGMTSGFDWY